MQSEPETVLQRSNFSSMVVCVYFSGSTLQADRRKSGGNFSASRNIFRKGFTSGENAN